MPTHKVLIETLLASRQRANATQLLGLPWNAPFSFGGNGWSQFLWGIFLVELVERSFEQLLVGELRVVFGYERRGECATQSIFHDLIILTGAKQDADRRTLVLFAYISVESFQIKIQLAEIFRLEPRHLQFKCDQAVETTMKEEQIESKVARSYLHRELRADKAKVPAKLQQKFSHSVEQPTMQITLTMFLRQSQKLNSVGISEDRIRTRMRLVHQWCHFCRGEHYPFKQCRVELAFQLPFGPVLLYRHAQVEFALFRGRLLCPRMMRLWLHGNWCASGALIGSSL